MATVSLPLAAALAEAGGAAAPPRALAGLRHALRAALVHGQEELSRSRSGYPAPVSVVFASSSEHLLAALPVREGFRADPRAAPGRAVLLAAAVVAVLLDLADAARPGAPTIRASELDGFLLLAQPARALDPSDLDELVPLCIEERSGRVDRLRVQGIAAPAGLLRDTPVTLREPIGAGHPLRVAEAVARLGGEPADPASVDAHEEAVLALLGQPAGSGATRPHEDPDPARRIARRIVQRLDGMGKWGGYHTDFAHLARGFAGNERALAQAVGESLIASGLLAEKPSVGQRHVYLNPRRAAEVRALIETGEAPLTLRLPVE